MTVADRAAVNRVVEAAKALVAVWEHTHYGSLAIDDALNPVISAVRALREEEG